MNVCLSSITFFCNIFFADCFVSYDWYLEDGVGYPFLFSLMEDFGDITSQRQRRRSNSNFHSGHGKNTGLVGPDASRTVAPAPSLFPSSSLPNKRDHRQRDSSHFFSISGTRKEVGDKDTTKEDIKNKNKKPVRDGEKTNEPQRKLHSKSGRRSLKNDTVEVHSINTNGTIENQAKNMNQECSFDEKRARQEEDNTPYIRTSTTYVYIVDVHLLIKPR